MLFSPPHLLDGPRWAGKRIGLLGGSFNPPHPGHVHISIAALTMMKLDVIWWLVTPHNPLKKAQDMAPYETRLELCRSIVDHPQILVTDLERQMGVNRSYDTILGLKGAFPRAQFVWLTGMDNALYFHRWYRWRDILGEMATAHIARPPAFSLPAACPLRQAESQTHRFLSRGEKVNIKQGFTYWILQTRLMDISSTRLRGGG